MRQLINGQYYRTNAQGALVPESTLKKVDMLRDDTVLRAVEGAEVLKKAAFRRRAKIWGMVQGFLKSAAEQHGAKYGGIKGNVTLTSLDGLKQIKVAVGEHKAINEGIASAKALVDECLDDWASGDGVPEQLRTIITQFFNVNKEGKIDWNLLAKMKRWDFDDARWQQAMQIIDDSIDIISKSHYLLFYTREKTQDRFKHISLDLAKMETEDA